MFQNVCRLGQKTKDYQGSSRRHAIRRCCSTRDEKFAAAHPLGCIQGTQHGLVPRCLRDCLIGAAERLGDHGSELLIRGSAGRRQTHVANGDLLDLGSDRRGTSVRLRLVEPHVFIVTSTERIRKHHIAGAGTIAAAPGAAVAV